MRTLPWIRNHTTVDLERARIYHAGSGGSADYGAGTGDCGILSESVRQRENAVPTPPDEDTRVRRLSDLDLLDRIATGREEALAELARRYRSGLISLITRRWIGDLGLAEEVASDTIFAVWRSAAGFERRSSVASWIYSIARFRAIEALRRKRAVTIPLSDAMDLPDQGPGPSEVFCHRETSVRVRHGLSELPEPHARVLEMNFIEGLSHRQISDRTGLPLGTLKSRIRDAKRLLARELVRRGTG